MNTAHPPTVLQDSFDPIDSSNWLFFPGGEVKQSCHSDRYSLVFDARDSQVRHSLTTRDLDLRMDNEPLLIEHYSFDDAAVDWTLQGGSVTGQCGPVFKGTR